MFSGSPRAVVGAVMLAAGVLLVGCASPGRNNAPVEDRGTSSAPRTTQATPAVATEPSTPPVKPLPGAENAGKPGYYTVKPGDTLIRISLDHGQNWKDVAKWNSIDKPNLIEVGQVLRVQPPVASPPPVVAASSAPSSNTAATGTEVPGIGAAAGTVVGVVTRPVTGAGAATAAASTVGAATASAVVATASAPKPVDVGAAGTDGAIAWSWPVNGPVLVGFDEVKNKGLDLGGVAGEPVLAAADGHVVYVGAGLRGYGNLIILKHNNVYLSAYAHNRVLLVKEEQAVRKGQKIAEMGNSDADRVKLHFEVRRQGKPVDPAKYLPMR